MRVQFNRELEIEVRVNAAGIITIIEIDEAGIDIM